MRGVSMNAAALAVGVASLLVGVSAGPVAAGQYNWMRDFVDLRLQAFIARTVGTETAAKLEPRIVGGRTAKPSSNPFQVALLNKGIPNNFDAQYCGGSLVKKNFIVTAAHSRRLRELAGRQSGL
jgi:hypothetical protein